MVKEYYPFYNVVGEVIDFVSTLKFSVCKLNYSLHRNLAILHIIGGPLTSDQSEKKKKYIMWMDKKINHQSRIAENWDIFNPPM